MSSVYTNQYQGQDFLTGGSGNPGIPFITAPPLTAAEQLVARRYQACTNAFNKANDVAQVGAITASFGCLYGGWKGPKKANGALKMSTVLGALECMYAATYALHAAQELISAEFIKCQLDVEADR